MRRRNQRILWLLNHKTLMPYEAGVLEDLGFEIFTPKIFPGTEEYRSCAVDYRYDAALTIPRRALERLNAFNFYDGTWPADIVTLLNRYFGTAIVVAHARQIPEAVDKFEGQIIFRTFGLAYSRNYVELLHTLYGGVLIAKIYRLGDRFWFGHGYEQMLECEPPLLARHAVYLPVGLAPSAWRNVGRWNGSIKKVLFACRNVVSNPTYAGVYQQFKRDFGDLPHVIVGSQDMPLDDPSVLGYVADEELEQLYLDCAALYYHSRAPRHVHYSPIEASISGMPLVFYRENLLGRIAGGAMAGTVEKTSEAHDALERILSGDSDFIERVRNDQLQIAYHFSDAYCRPIWERAVKSSGAFPQPKVEPRGRVFTREARRVVLTPFARGRTKLPERRDAPLPPYTELRDPLSAPSEQGDLAEGIDFRTKDYPSFVSFVNGVCDPEPWGRWSRGPTVSFLFSQFLDKSFRMVVVGGAYGKNIGAPVKVRIGSAERLIRFQTSQREPQTIVTDFSLHAPSNLVEFEVPYPTVPQGDERPIGLALVQLRFEPLAGGT